MISSIIRILRFVFMVLSLLLPSLYVAVLTYHQEMVPTALLISVASSRESVPFPALVEALMMEVTFKHYVKQESDFQNRSVPLLVLSALWSSVKLQFRPVWFLLQWSLLLRLQEF